MRRDVAALLLATALSCAAFAVPAQGRAILGIGEQKYGMFSDSRFEWLGIRHARLAVSWDVQLRHDWERAWIGKWLRGAKRDGVVPLVVFGHDWTGARRKLLPSSEAFRHAFRAFRARYPWVREYTAWNEANHCSQPTCHHPEAAAAYYDVVRDECPSCTVVAADVLDQSNMAPWLRAFQRAVRHRPAIWGLHNYLDANRLRTTGTRQLLSLVRGDVWFTETGGVVRRTRYKGQAAFPESPEHAAKATTWILRVGDTHARVKRIYIYQWNADTLTQAWDSGLIDPFGQHRPAFEVVARHQGRDPSQAPADPAFQSPQPEPGPQPQPGPGPQPQPQPKPPPTCFLQLICPPGG